MVRVRPYAIWSPPYDHAVGGIRALHRLRDELLARGCEATVGPEGDPAAIAVYPEIVTGNPFGAERVVRWLLNVASPTDGMVFSWARSLGDGLLLTVDIVERDLFRFRSGPRDGVVYWVHKGTFDASVLPPGARQITHTWPETREGVAEVLAGASLLISFDPFTMLVLESVLVGTPVLVHAPRSSAAASALDGWLPYGVAWSPDELPWALSTVGMAGAAYDVKRAEFARTVDDFVAVTQERWP